MWRVMEKDLDLAFFYGERQGEGLGVDSARLCRIKYGNLPRVGVSVVEGARSRLWNCWYQGP